MVEPKHHQAKHHLDYLHHQGGITSDLIREMVFGLEDGMVSTLGAITGIATSTNNHFFVVLSGSVIIAVESISMAVGSYLSNNSEQAIDERIIAEEKDQIKKFPVEEKAEMIDLFMKDGWSKHLASTMAEETAQNPKLMLREMSYRELNLVPDSHESPVKKANIMFASYVIGGLIPLLPYFFLPVSKAIFVSIPVTMVGLFALGVFTSKYSKRTWWKAGLEMFGLAMGAAIIGYVVGQLVDGFWLK